MGIIPNVEQAKEIFERYNLDAFHRKHAQIVSGVLRWFAKKHDPENEEYFAAVGMLHDVDFEHYPDGHCIKCYDILREYDIDEQFIDAIASHGYEVFQTDTPPKRYMEKVLYAVDELTGLIGAAALMRPSKSVSDMTCKSVMKKYKSPSFAIGVSRDIIAKGAEMMGVTLEELIDDTILAMQSLMDQMEI